jgi:Ran GTPase-activating protein (RanGAP) involved in mRNA processing and transport
MYKKEREAMDTKDEFVDIILSSNRIGSSKASEKIKNEFRKLGKINLRYNNSFIGKRRRKIFN